MATKSKKSNKVVKSAARKPAAKTMATSRDKRIVKVGPQPRREGTAAFKRYAEMARYVSKHRGATVGTVLDETAYRSDDFRWDVERQHISVR